MRPVYLASLISAKRDTPAADIAVAKTEGGDKTLKVPIYKNPHHDFETNRPPVAHTEISSDSSNNNRLEN